MSRKNPVSGTFGAQLRLARLAAGLSARAAARHLGLSHQGYNNYEQGLREPPAQADIITKESLLQAMRNAPKKPAETA